MQNLNDDFFRYIETEKESDTARLMFQKEKLRSSFDVGRAIEQIEIRKKIRLKLPTWFANYQLLFPSRLSSEQASSEQTALYKQSLVKGSTVCDLTGGLGIDLYYMSKKADKAIYVERYADYCETAGHNFKELQATNIEVVNSDGTLFITEVPYPIDTVYIDPARRGAENKRLFALSDYEPNVLSLLPRIASKTQRVIIKVSPMADVTECLHQLRQVSEIHVLAVKNECKEILFVLDWNSASVIPPVYCTNLGYDGQVIESFHFTQEEETDAVAVYAGTVGRYLYEPNVSILKAGAFKIISARYGIEKIAPNSHLYTSDQWIDSFPGRKFTVLNSEPYSNRKLNDLSKQHRCANITVRNFPASVDELRKKSKMKEGGEVYLFATTSLTGQKLLIEAEKTACGY